MAKISSAGFRAPAPFEGINVNFCKNPKCNNFGVPERAHRKKRMPGVSPEPGDYTRVSAGKAKPQLKCGLCGEIFPVRSNQGVHEELTRLMAYLTKADEPSCANEPCTLFDVPLSLAGGMYAQRGKTAAGTQRYRCGACMKTFSGAGKSTKKHRMPHKNREVFSLLINKVPLRRISAITELNRGSVYQKIEFLHRQCLRFSSDRERRLLEGHALPKLYLSTDRQTLAVNWNTRENRRNVTLQAIATADLVSGYVFGMDLNFDSGLDVVEIDADAARLGDGTLPQPYRRYARLWLRSDYDASVAESQARQDAKKPKRAGAYVEDELNAAITDAYENASVREDVEEVNVVDDDQALPSTGVEVRDQYTVYAHFLMLERLVRHAPKVRCYMDQDSGFRAGFMAAFHTQVKARTADAWFVSVLKEQSIDVKRAAVAKAKRRLEAAISTPNTDGTMPTESEAQLALTLAEMKRMASIGKWDDRWLVHPSPTMAEPGKGVCWLTDIDTPEAEPQLRENQLNHMARLYLKGSLHSVDRFFMRVRRSLTLAERPYATASSARRMWHGYSAYQPRNLAMVLHIFKVAYNFCLVSDKGVTPAMKLGLAKGPVALEDIVYF